MARTASAEAAGDAPHVDEQALVFGGPCGPLVGVIARPHGAVAASVLMVSGAGGTRAGRGRMVTPLARALAARGVASLRFDVTGQGDSPGALQAPAERAGDLAAAARTLRDAFGSAPKAAWLLADGEDAVTAATEHAALAASDLRPAGLFLLLHEHDPVASLVSNDAGVGVPLGRPGVPTGTPQSSGAPRIGLLARLRRMLGLDARPARARPDDAAADATPNRRREPRRDPQHPSISVPSTEAASLHVEPAPRGPVWDALLARHPRLAGFQGGVVLVVHGPALRALALRRTAAPQDDDPDILRDAGTDDPFDAIAGFLARQLR